MKELKILKFHRKISVLEYLIKRRLQQRFFSCEICENFQNIFYKTPPVASKARQVLTTENISLAKFL